MNKSIPLTQAQYDELVQRRKYIIEEERPRIAEQIDIARGFGDLSENAEYHAAKEEQGQLEAELIQIEHKIKFAKIIKHKGNITDIDLGHTITIQSLDNDQKYKFTLIGQDGNGITEVDITSKVGAALLGKRLGNIISYEANDSSLGELRFKITHIE